VAVDVVAAAARCGAEHRRCPGAREREDVIRRRRRLGQRRLLVSDGVLDHEVDPYDVVVATPCSVEDDAAVAGVDRTPFLGHGVRKADGGGGAELGSRPAGVEAAQQGGRAVEHAESAAEAGVGDEAAPALAHEGGADEELGFVRGEAEEDLSDEIIRQRRRRHAARSPTVVRRRRSERFGVRGRGLGPGSECNTPSPQHVCPWIPMQNRITDQCPDIIVARTYGLEAAV
jgi:hypothetical protein